MTSARTTAIVVSVMGKVLRGEISRSDIGGMEVPSHRAYAAIAWMLGHPDDYLDEHFYVLGRYDRILHEIAGTSGNYVIHSKTAGLHTSRSAREPGVPRITYKTEDNRRWHGVHGSFTQTLSRVVMLTPPEELMSLLPKKPVALPPKTEEERLAEGLVSLILHSGEEVTERVYRILGERRRK